MSVDLLGKSGPHPDLSGLVISHFMRTSVNLSVRREQLEVLQQRTFFDLPHPNPQLRKSNRTSISSCLAILHLPAPGDDLLVLCAAAQEQAQAEWLIVGSTVQEMGNPPLKPYVAVGHIMPKTALVFGLFVVNPQVAALRVELADGTIAEDSVSNKTLHLLVPFRTNAAIAREALVRVLDQGGKEIVAQRAHVQQSPPPGVTPRQP